MKFSPQAAWPLSYPGTKHVYLEGQTVEVNSSVLDWAEKSKSEYENNPEAERLREAKQFAMGRVPTLATETMDHIGRYFGRPKNIENARNVKQLEDAVRKSVLTALKEAPAIPGTTRPRWAGNYLRTIEDIEKDENKAIETLRDSDRALQAVGQLKEKYERQAKVLVERRNKTDQASKSFKNFFRGIGSAVVNVEYDRNDNTSEHYRFSKGNEVALQIFNQLEAKIQTKKENTQEVFNENKSHIQEGFELLSVTQKEQFVKYVAAECSGTNVIDVSPHNWAKQVVFGISFEQRTELFKDLKLDPTAQHVAFEKEAKLFDGIENELKERRSALEYDLAFATPANLKTLKKDLSGINKDESFDPDSTDDLNKFVTDLRGYLEREGDLGSNDILKRYPRGESLNSTEQVTAYLNYLSNNHKILVKDKMAKGLKAKLLTYLEYLENVDAPDEVEGQSKDFLGQRDIVKNRYEAGKKAINDVDVTDITKIDDDTYEKINTFVGQAKREKRVYENFKTEKNNLSDSEVELLDKLHSEIDKIAQQFEALRGEWETQTKGLSEEEKHLKNEIEKAEDKKDEAENAKLLAEKSITLLEDTTIESAEKRLEKSEEAYETWATGKTAKTLTPTDRTRGRALEKDIKDAQRSLDGYQKDLSSQHQALLKASEAEAAAGAEFKKARKKETDFKSSKTSYDFLKSKKHFAETLAVLDEEIKDLSKYKKAPDAKSTEAQIKRHLLEISAKENNQQHQARLIELQGRNLTALQTMPSGSTLNRIEFVQYLHGREMSAHSALLGAKSRPLGSSTILGKTDDAVILYNNTTDQLVIVQKAKESGKVEVLCFAAPSDFDPHNNLPPSYIPEKSDYMGELTSITA